MLLLPRAPGALPPSAAVLPLPEILKFARVLEPLFPPEVAKMIAFVPVVLSDTALFVIAMTSALLLGMPAVAPGPEAVELPIESLLPAEAPFVTVLSLMAVLRRQ